MGANVYGLPTFYFFLTLETFKCTNIYDNPNESIGHCSSDIGIILPPYLLRNHVSLWGLMFMDYQHFTFFWHWEVILWIIGLLQHDVRLFIFVPYVCGDINLWRKVTNDIHEHWFFMSIDEFTVLQFIFFCRERFCLIQKRPRWQANRCYQISLYHWTHSHYFVI